jgi:carbon storage regulator
MPAAVRRAPGEPFDGGCVVLVLSRRVGEEIVIPEYGITVTIVGVRGRTVRLGITAPPNVPILRGEIVPFYRRMLRLGASPQDLAGESE